jgi:pre-rRNA-processing protein TSR1
VILDAGRDPVSVLDACKVADVICPVLSCRDADPTHLKLAPDDARAFSDSSYDLLCELRSQGMPPCCCLLQDLEHIDAKHQPYLKKLFTRFFESEFGKDQPVLELASVGWQGKLLRQLGNIRAWDPEWRKGRAYMLVEKAEYSPLEGGTLAVEGVLKGGPLNANQLVHLTGIGDFQQSSIALLDSRSHIDRKGKPLRLKVDLPVQHAFAPESLEAFADRLTSTEQRDQDINEALRELGLSEQVME